MPTYYQKICEHCSIEFKVLPKNRKQRFCKPECYNDSILNPNKLQTCLHCNTALNRLQIKFCSRSCSTTYYNQIRYSEQTVTQTLRECQHCRTLSTRKYCSNTCKVSANRIKIYGSIEMALELRRIKRNECSAHYRAKVRNQTPEDIDRKAIQEFYAKCPIGHEVDHIIPISKGGLHSLENLQYLTLHENRSKGSKILN